MQSPRECAHTQIAAQLKLPPNELSEDTNLCDMRGKIALTMYRYRLRSFVKFVVFLLDEAQLHETAKALDRVYQDENLTVKFLIDNLTIVRDLIKKALAPELQILPEDLADGASLSSIQNRNGDALYLTKAFIRFTQNVTDPRNIEDLKKRKETWDTHYVFFEVTDLINMMFLEGKAVWAEMK